MACFNHWFFIEQLTDTEIKNLGIHQISKIKIATTALKSAIITTKTNLSLS